MNEGKTMNIHNSWRDTISKTYNDANGWSMGTTVNTLDSYSLQELNHLKWLIDQQIEVLQNANI